MKLQEIIQTNDAGTQSILVELLHKYKKSLYTYYKRYYTSEPVLMVTTVFNACQYALIVPSNEFSEAIDIYLQDQDLDEDDKANEVDLIGFQSIMLKDF